MIQFVDFNQEIQILIIIYDLVDVEDIEFEVFFCVVFFGSFNFSIYVENVFGVIGFLVVLGEGLQMIWNYVGEIGNSDMYDFKIIVDDGYDIFI